MSNKEECQESISYKRSLLIGMLLGDSSSRKYELKNGNLRAAFAVGHAEGQKDLVEWKATTLNKIFNSNCAARPVKNGDNLAYRFSLCRGKRLRVIHDWFHKNGKKVITQKVRFMNHPIGLAMLLCDDGSIRKRKKFHLDGTVYYLAPSICIATHCFGKEEVEILLNQIEVMCGAKGYINVERRWRKGKRVEYQRSNFNSKNSRLLWEYVRDWIPDIPSMRRKFSFAFERFN